MKGVLRQNNASCRVECGGTAVKRTLVVYACLCVLYVSVLVFLLLFVC